MESLEQALQRSFPDTLLVVDRRGTVHGALCGHTPTLFQDSPVGRTLATLWPPPAAEAVGRMLRRVLKSREPYLGWIELPGARELRQCELRLHVHGRDRVLLLLRDAATLAHAATAGDSVAERDRETGLHTHRWFVQQAVDRCNEARLREAQAAIVLVEFPEIDTINASFGRRVGGELLKVAARRIAARLRQRPEDRPEALALVARNGIGLLLSPVGSRDEVSAVTRRLREALDDPFAWEGREFNLRSGIGIAMFPRDGHDVEALLRNAHTALGETAFAPSSDAVFYSDTMPVRSLARMDVADELRIAMDRGQLTLRFAPWLRAKPLRTVGLEVSAALASPIREELAGEPLASHAEAAGLATVLLRQTLEGALRAAPGLSAPGADGRPAGLMLQLRTSQLHAQLAAEIAARCRQHDFEPSRLYLGVPEETLAQGTLVEVLTALRKQGFRVVLRDFGATQVRLANLGSQPLWGVVLADTLVNGSRSSAGRRTCSAIIGLARALGLRVMAAGVEDEREAATLVEAGCTDLTGPLFGTGLAEEAARERLRAAPENPALSG